MPLVLKALNPNPAPARGIGLEDPVTNPVSGDFPPTRNLEGPSKKRFLVIRIEVKNLSHTRKIDYRTLAGSQFAVFNNGAALKDNFGNGYNGIAFGSFARPDGRVENDSIYPGKSLNDVLVFEEPIERIEFLELTLPLKSVGSDDDVVLRIPKAMIAKELAVQL